MTSVTSLQESPREKRPVSSSRQTRPLPLREAHQIRRACGKSFLRSMSKLPKSRQRIEPEERSTLNIPSKGALWHP